MKLAVLFPGIGYTVSRPLLYYAGKVASEKGYKVLPVSYAGLPKDVRNDPLKKQRGYDSAYEQAEEQLRNIDWPDCEDIVFIGKSIGTVVAVRYAEEHDLDAKLILLTPLVDTFMDLPEQSGRRTVIAFHGTADPWAATGEIESVCKKRGIPLYLTEGANHSLETGNVKKDLATLTEAMGIIEEHIATA